MKLASGMYVFCLLHAEIFPSGEKGVSVHLSGLHELVYTGGYFEVDLLRPPVDREADGQVRMGWEVGDALQVDHLLELGARLNRRVHRFHLKRQGVAQLSATRHIGLEVLSKESATDCNLSITVRQYYVAFIFQEGVLTMKG